MEKNAARSPTCYQRLLAVLLFLVFFGMLPAGGYCGQPKDIHLSADAAAVQCGQTLTITLTIPQGKKYGTPQLQLEELTHVAELEKSTARITGKDIRLECIYRMQKAGIYTVHPVVHWKKRTHALDPFTVKVSQPPLSAATRFEWFIIPYSEENLQSLPPAIQPDMLQQNSTPIIQGNRYLLYMTAVFSLPQTEESVKNGIFLHNPPPITKIECGTPENALLSRLDFSGTNVFIPIPVFEAERFVLAVFEWIPLHTGKQPLPIGKIYFSAENTAGSGQRDSNAAPQSVPPAQTVPAFCSVQGRLQHLPSEGIPLANIPPVHAAFIDSETTPPIETATAVQTADTMSAVKALAACRKKELRSIYPFALYAERRKLESALQITAALPIYPRGLWVVCAAAAAAGTACGIMQLFRKKWLTALVFCTLGICCTIAAAIFYVNNTALQGVCFTTEQEVPIRRIPETAGSNFSTVRAGESVRILQNTAHWYYIKTAAGHTGWIPQENIIIYN